MTIANIFLVVTATTMALIAGLFYSYSCSVNPGLGRLPDTLYLTAMQSINKAILNPVFFASFAGTLLLLPICTYMHYGQPVSTRFWLLLAAALIYAIGVFAVTAFGNVPLNNTLNNFNIESASIKEIAALRTKFEGPWNTLHLVRTLANITSLVLVLIACVSRPSVMDLNK